MTSKCAAIIMLNYILYGLNGNGKSDRHSKLRKLQEEKSWAQQWPRNLKKTTPPQKRNITVTKLLTFLYSLSSISLNSYFKQTCTHTRIPLFLLWRGLPLVPSACARVVSVMTMSQRSSLPISQAIITPTHMELSIRRLLHTGTQPPSMESERVSIEMKQRRESEFPTASYERPLAVTISSMRRVSFNYSNCAAIPQFTECHETTEEWSSCDLLVF